MGKQQSLLLILPISWLVSCLVDVRLAGAEENDGRKLAGENPFTAKAALIRHWKTQISNDLPMPWFFLNKASPLDAVDLATFSKLADQNSLSTHLHNFCSKANLLCAPGLSQRPVKHDKDVNFTSYIQQNFTNYGTKRVGGVDSFANYSADDSGFALNNFRQYSRNSTVHDHAFINYADTNGLPDQSFNSYSKTAVGGNGRFDNYQDGQNLPHLEFASYNEETSGGTAQTFSSYSNEANSGDQNFRSYDKNGIGPENNFNTYSNNSNVITSSFTHYGDGGKGIGTRDAFVQYGFDGNFPRNNFTSYLDEGNGSLIFSSYSDQANIGQDDFKSYAKNAKVSDGHFENYGQSVNLGPVNFTSYGEGADGLTRLEFNTYKENYNFKKYGKEGVAIAFGNYLNESASTAGLVSSGREANNNDNNNNKKKNRWVVEPGKFFREHMLRPGTVMPMPDIKDKMPQRSFLPRTITAKLPFSSGKIDQLKEIFHASDNPVMAKMIGNALNECERAPSPGETKRCAGSGEEMIDFVKSVLGSNIAVRTTENIHGASEDILIGSVKAINGGKVTESVSCHQCLYPYLLYYCHSVPKVRVYEADILDPNSRVKINHGVAICHVDTSSWSAGHAAFLALGSGPGKIEVCHWIFENDMTWAIADL